MTPRTASLGSSDGPYGLDLFISYSRHDKKFAAALERALKGYRPPKTVAAPHRYLQVFRDEQDMTGSEYHESIRRYLLNSRNLVVICSPAARASAYVDDEIRIFTQERGAQGIIPVLIAGIPNNEAAPGQDSELAFPEALCNALSMPLAKDYRTFDFESGDRVNAGQHVESWYWLLADIFGVSRAEIEERDKARNRAIRRRWTTAGCVGALLAAASLVTIGRLNSQKQVEQKIATSRKLAGHVTQLLDSHLDEAALLAVEAYREFPTADATSAVVSALTANPRLLRILRGHQRSVSTLAFSPDGGLLASGSLDGRVILWRTDSWRQEGQPLEKHTDKVMAVSFNWPGDVLASGGFDQQIILWDVRSHAARNPALRAHTARVDGLAFGQKAECPVLASGGWDQKVFLWDVARGATNGGPLDAGGDVNTLALSPDCRTLVAGAANGTVTFWDLSTRQVLRRVPYAQESPQTAAFRDDGRLVATGGPDGVVWVWNVEKLRDLHPSDPIGEARFAVGLDTGGNSGGPVLAVSFSSDGKVLAVGRDRSARKQLEGYFAGGESAQPRNAGFGGFDETVVSLASSPTSRILVSGLRDSSMIVWDTSVPVSQIRPLGRLLHESGTDRVDAMALSPSGKELVTAGSAGKLTFWDTQGTKILTTSPIGRVIQALAFSPDGSLLVSQGSEGDLVLWDANTREKIATLGRAESALGSSVVFSPDGKMLARLEINGKIDVWDVKARTAAGSMDAGNTGFSPADAEIEAGQGFLGIPGISADSLKGKLHGTTTMNLLFSADGKTLISCVGARRIVFWDVKTQSRKPIAITAPVSVEHMALSRDGRTLAAALVSGDITLWSTATGQMMGEPITQAGARRVAFGQHDKILAVGGHDGTLSLWDVDGHRQLGAAMNERFSEGDWWVTGLGFSRDGETLATTGYDGQVVVWNLSGESWVRTLCDRVNRNLTCDEWQTFLGSGPYRKSCPALPGPDRCTGQPGPQPRKETPKTGGTR